MEMQKDPRALEQVESYYNDYKKKYEVKQNKIFFFNHKDEPWFREKYDSELRYKWMIERNMQAQKNSKIFNEQVLAGVFKVKS